MSTTTCWGRDVAGEEAEEPVGPERGELIFDDPAARFGAGGDALRSPDVGLRVVRGSAVRVAGYGLGMVFTAAASVLLLRHLGVVDFGRFVTVMSLVAIVSGVTDAGLTAVGSRDLALRPAGEGRRRLVENLLGLRLVITPVGVLAATAFALVAGYDSTLVLGTALAGVGLVLTSAQATLTLPLAADLRLGKLTAIEVLKQAAMFMGVAVLVAAGAGLGPFFSVSIAVGIVALAMSPRLLGRDFTWRPAFDRSEWRTLAREALPLAAAVVVGVFYFRLLIVLMSLLSSGVATGLFATSFRVTELLYSAFTLVVTGALPVLAVASENRSRLRYMLQRMIELALIVSCGLVVVVVIAAEPVLDLLGGSQYRDAAPVLRIQAFALIPVFVSQVCVVALISIRRQAVQAVATSIALLIVLALGGALIPVYDATGAAIAALVAECVLALLLLTMLVRADTTLRPSFVFVWKIAVASGLGAASILVPGLPSLGTAALGAALYAGGVWITGAIPSELLDAFGLRARA